MWHTSLSRAQPDITAALVDPDQRLDNVGTGTGRQSVGADQDLALGVGRSRGLPTLRSVSPGRSLPRSPRSI